MYLTLKKLNFFVISLTLLFSTIFYSSAQSQSICSSLSPFCSSNALTFPNVHDGSFGPTTIDYGGGVNGCGTTYSKNPVWYSFRTAQSGVLQMNIAQSNGDVDFAMWGPFTDVSSG